MKQSGKSGPFPRLRDVGLMEVNVPKYMDILSNLVLEFDRHFEDFRDNATVFELYAQTYSVHVDTVSEKFQMELTELQSDSQLFKTSSSRQVCKDLQTLTGHAVPLWGYLPLPAGLQSNES